MLCLMRLGWLGVVFWLGALTLVARERPHIVLVMADDQGWGDMAYQGHPLVQTPHFDQAAAAGLRFDRFYAAAPVCSPTRASVMTGRHPNRMGVFKWGYPLRPQESSLAEVLRTAGYRTGHFGKWHLGSVRPGSPSHPGNHGFDEWLSAPNFYDNDPILSHRGEAVKVPGESSMVAVEAALDWMRAQQGQSVPLFTVVWFGSPHAPHRAVDEDRAPYLDQPEKVQHFLGEVTGMDRAFGRLRSGLETLGMADSTLLWYCSDNGALPRVGSAGPFRGNKGKVYEGGLLVPSILLWPEALDAPRTTMARCNTADIYPTLVELVGIEVPHQAPLDGVSLLPLIVRDEPPQRRGMGFWDYPAPGIGTPSAKWMAELWEAQQAGRKLAPHDSSLRAAELPSPPYPLDKFPGHAAWIQGGWKLHRLEPKEGGDIRWELYNLKRDPFEKTDLASVEQARVEDLQVGMQAWLRSVVQSLNGADYPSQGP